MGNGFSKYRKQAQMLQQQVSAMQENLQKTEVEGIAGNGLVKMKLNGLKEILDVQISPDCVDKDDIEGLQDLIIAAYNDAMKKLADASPMPDLPFNF